MIEEQIYIYLKGISATVRRSAYAVVILALIFASSCAPSPQHTELTLPTIIANYTAGNIDITILTTPSKLLLNKDLFLDIQVNTPIGTTATVPSLTPYCSGFDFISEFDTATTTINGTNSFIRRVRLQPTISTEYTLEPFVISYNNRSYSPARSGIINTDKIIFRPELPTVSPTDDIIIDFAPIQTTTSHKAKTAKRIALLLFMLIVTAQTIRHKLHAKNSIPLPRSSSLSKLDKLLCSDLIAQNKFAEFYFELTNIVRCYIEEMLEIPSTHQTSEELMHNLSDNPLIDPAMIADLKKFFSHADLIKFATAHPTDVDLANDIAWATLYIESNIVPEDTEEEAPC